jgi:hypothetical protein
MTLFGIAGRPRCLPRVSAGSHAGGHSLTDERGFQLGHGADDGEHRSAHGAIGIDLVLYADEAYSEVIELFKRRQQMVSFPLNYNNGWTDSKDVSRFLNPYNCAVLNTIIP